MTRQESFLAIAERLLLTLWVGALCAVGYLAVPILFASLDDRMLAGFLAGRMFTAVNYLGFVCGGMLLFVVLIREGWRAFRPLLVVAMLLLVAVGFFWLQPVMAALKVGGLPEGSAKAAQFARLHGVAAILYLVDTLIGLALVVGFGRQRVTGA